MKKEYFFNHPKTKVILNDSFIEISRGNHNYMINKQLRGTHSIPYKSIVEIKYKRASSISKGYIQFTTAQSQLLGALRTINQPQNAIEFNRDNNDIILEIKQLVEAKMNT